MFAFGCKADDRPVVLSAAIACGAGHGPNVRRRSPCIKQPGSPRPTAAINETRPPMNGLALAGTARRRWDGRDYFSTSTTYLRTDLIALSRSGARSVQAF